MLTWNRSIEVPNTVWDSVARLLKADLHRMELALRLAAYKQLEDQSLVPINTFLKDYSKKVKDLPAGIPKEGEELRNWIFPADEVFDFISPIDTNAYHTPDFVAPKFPSKIVDTTIPLPLGHWNKYSKVTTNKEWVNYLGACLVEQTKALGKVPSSLYSQEKEAERLFSDLSSVYKK